ncbi:MAG: endonuclease III [Desulfobacteraceae bacterium]|nr:endonuclease III [Desulfobacteraceae bacterium]
MTVSQSKITQILGILQARYPVVRTQLNHKSPFQLLTATILSAQCTDNQVNKVTEDLFAKYPEPEDIASAQLKDIKSIIYSTGFYNNKSKNIIACARALLNEFNGEVPSDIEKLITLPGVGRKTANVVLSTIFNIPAIVVDTHVLRISYRLGLTVKKDPVKVEFDLMEKLPKAKWSDFSLWMIYFGREICDAKKPNCSDCPLYDVCDFYPGG